MSTQGRNEPQPFDTARGSGARSDARVETVADSVMGPIFPAQAATSGHAKSWFSIATVLTLIALAACAAAAVAATYGPVFTQPLIGP